MEPKLILDVSWKNLKCRVSDSYAIGIDRLKPTTNDGLIESTCDKLRYYSEEDGLRLRMDDNHGTLTFLYDQGIENKTFYIKFTPQKGQTRCTFFWSVGDALYSWLYEFCIPTLTSTNEIEIIFSTDDHGLVVESIYIQNEVYHYNEVVRYLLGSGDESDGNKYLCTRCEIGTDGPEYWKASKVWDTPMNLKQMKDELKLTSIQSEIISHWNVLLAVDFTKSSTPIIGLDNGFSERISEVTHVGPDGKFNAGSSHYYKSNRGIDLRVARDTVNLLQYDQSGVQFDIRPADNRIIVLQFYGKFNEQSVDFVVLGYTVSAEDGVFIRKDSVSTINQYLHDDKLNTIIIGRFHSQTLLFANAHSVDDSCYINDNIESLAKIAIFSPHNTPFALGIELSFFALTNESFWQTDRYNSRINKLRVENGRLLCGPDTTLRTDSLIKDCDFYIADGEFTDRVNGLVPVGYMESIVNGDNMMITLGNQYGFGAMVLPSEHTITGRKAISGLPAYNPENFDIDMSTEILIKYHSTYEVTKCDNFINLTGINDGTVYPVNTDTPVYLLCYHANPGGPDSIYEEGYFRAISRRFKIRNNGDTNIIIANNYTYALGNLTIIPPKTTKWITEIIDYRNGQQSQIQYLMDVANGEFDFDVFRDASFNVVKYAEDTEELDDGYRYIPNPIPSGNSQTTSYGNVIKYKLHEQTSNEVTIFQSLTEFGEQINPREGLFSFEDYHIAGSQGLLMTARWHNRHNPMVMLKSGESEHFYDFLPYDRHTKDDEFYICMRIKKDEYIETRLVSKATGEIFSDRRVLTDEEIRTASDIDFTKLRVLGYDYDQWGANFSHGLYNMSIFNRILTDNEVDALVKNEGYLDIPTIGEHNMVPHSTVVRDDCGSFRNEYVVMSENDYICPVLPGYIAVANATGSTNWWVYDLTKKSGVFDNLGAIDMSVSNLFDSSGHFFRPSGHSDRYPITVRYFKKEVTDTSIDHD